MTAPVYPHLVFSLPRPHCSTSQHYGCKSQCQIADLKEVSGVFSGSQIVVLRKASLVPGYVRKAQLVLTGEIST